MDKLHTMAVAGIAAQVRRFYKDKRPFYVYHGSTNSTRIMSFKRNEMVDVSALGRVLEIDPTQRTAVVEPNVPMDRLVEATLRHGLIPPVVMEFPGITVGGGIQGGAGESGSFRWGCFNRICNWYEMVLADGTVVTASADNHADLFNGTAGSYGTLGIVTAAELQLIPAQRYVSLTYLPVTGFQEAVARLGELSTGDYDFIDGIMFARNEGVIMVGRFSSAPTGPVQRFSRARDPWFYLHSAQVSARKQEFTESVPLVDYLFRYDRGAFWVGRFAFERFGVPFNGFSRWLLNPILHTRKLYEALQESGASQEHVVQDLALPRNRAVEFMEFVHRSLHVYPLWLCPLRPDPDSPLQSNHIDTPLVINVGVWGSRIEDYQQFIRANRLIEAKLRDLGGKKWFYAHSYYDESEFWQIYDRRWYDTLRRKYHATTLPSVYEKIRVRERYEVNARKGLLRTLLGRARLRLRD